MVAWSIFALKEYMSQHIKKCKCTPKMIEINFSLS
jgi:hypothetical protein